MSLTTDSLTKPIFRLAGGYTRSGKTCIRIDLPGRAFAGTLGQAGGTQLAQAAPGAGQGGPGAGQVTTH